MFRAARLTRVFAVASLLQIAASAWAQAGPARQLIKLADGQDAIVAGSSYRARGATIAIASTSSDLITVAVVSGVLIHGRTTARAGQALVAPIDASDAHRFGFDAAHLAATVPPAWKDDVAGALQQLASRQRRAKFWGLTEPIGINASAPVAPQVEAVRHSYLGSDTITALRRAAQGKPQRLASLTAKRFVEAMAASDTQVVADLIDPKPFTDVSGVAADWHAARAAFAARLVGDRALRAAIADASPVEDETRPGRFALGPNFVLSLVARDRAFFVTALERMP